MDVIEQTRPHARRTRSAEAGLAGLKLSAGPLSPPFSPEVQDYTLTVAHAVGSLMLLALTADAGATLTVNGCPLPSGRSSPALPLAVGSTRFTLQVTAEDGRQRHYRIGVTRAAAPLAVEGNVMLLLPASELPPGFLAGALAGLQGPVLATTLATTLAAPLPTPSAPAANRVAGTRAG